MVPPNRRVQGKIAMPRPVTQSPGWRPTTEYNLCSDPVEALAADKEWLGRSRGGLTPKIHPAVDRPGLPISILLTEGQAGDNPQLVSLREQICAVVPGRPCSTPDAVLADKAYSRPSARAVMRTKRIRFTYPERSNQIARRRAEGIGQWVTVCLRS